MINRHIKIYILVTILALTATLTMPAAPARQGTVYLSQPDGTTFAACLRGDEFVKILTTVQGNAIIQDEEGWYCYAYYDDQGRKASSGFRVNDPSVPVSIISTSRYIPYQTLSQKGRSKRLASYETFRNIDDRALTKAGKVVHHGVIILAGFNDVPFKYPASDFVDMLTAPGYDGKGAFGCALDYFNDQYEGKEEFNFAITTTTVTLPQDRAYYGKNNDEEDDEHPAEMIRDACVLADAQIDYSQYAQDGTVEFVYVFFAGNDEAQGGGDNCIWSHSWSLSGAGIDLELDGVKIDRYACCSELFLLQTSGGKVVEEMAGIGTFCHEFGHILGLPDFYDTDYEKSGGRDKGLWGTSLMDSGNYNNNGVTPPYFNCIERAMLGISDPLPLPEGKVAITPVQQNTHYYYSIYDLEDKNEFYMFECRDGSKWDKYIGGKGMLVYHIDMSGNPSGESDNVNNGRPLTARQRWIYGVINANPAHPCADLIEAYKSAENPSQIFFPYKDNYNSLTPESSTPVAFWQDNSRSLVANVSITGIKFGSNGAVEMGVIQGENEFGPPDVVLGGTDKFQDGAIVSFESSKPFDGEATIKWGESGKAPQIMTLMPYESGKYAAVFHNLGASKTYTLTISFIVDGIEGKSVSTSFLTSSRGSVPFPYIHLKNITRNSDGSFPSGTKFPLRVYNADDVDGIIWYLDGRPVSVGPDGYWHATGSGELKAEIIYKGKQGTRDVLVKKIVIK